MPTVRNLFVRIRIGARPPRPALVDRGPAAAPPAAAIPRPSPPPPRRTPALAAVPPPTPPSGRRVSKLAALTPVLGRKRAGQALWAPERLTPAERATAARILKELDQ